MTFGWKADYEVASIGEAKAYVKHPVLGARLIECTELVNRVSARNIHDIFGYPDDLKFRSSMTLFAKAAPEIEVFSQALRKYFGGEGDGRTEELIQSF